MNLGENIYHYRTQKNMSQGDLADALDVSRQSVSKWENNSATPELEKLMKMAQIFDITIDELISGEKQDIPTPTPPPAPAPAAPPAAKEGLSARQILGIILLSLGGLLSIIILLVGILKENQYGEDMLVAFLFIGLPVILIGMICLLIKKHTLLVCGWVLYIFIFFLLTLVSRSGDMLLTYLLLALGTALSIGSLVVLWSRKNQASLVAKILLTLLIVGVLWTNLVSSLAVSSFHAYTSEESYIVTESAVTD